MLTRKINEVTNQYPKQINKLICSFNNHNSKYDQTNNPPNEYIFNQYSLHMSKKLKYILCVL